MIARRTGSMPAPGNRRLPFPLPQKVLEESPKRGYSRNMATPRPQPLELHAHAMDNLRYIRQTIERAGSFTAVPGLGGVLMGSTALAAAWAAGPAARGGRWVAVWMAEAILAAAIGVAGSAWKSHRAKLSLLSGPGRKFAAAFTPAMAAGALLTAVLFQHGMTALLPGLWLLLYGSAIVSGGSASVRVVPLMGFCFMAAGAAALLEPAAGCVLLAAGFAGLHILFGTIIAVKYGG